VEDPEIPEGLPEPVAQLPSSVNSSPQKEESKVEEVEDDTATSIEELKWAYKTHLGRLTVNHITETSKFAKPHPVVIEVLTKTCQVTDMKIGKPDKHWAKIQGHMKNPKKFIDTLINVEIEKLAEGKMKKLRETIKGDSWRAHSTRNVSEAVHHIAEAMKTLSVLYILNNKLDPVISPAKSPQKEVPSEQSVNLETEVSRLQTFTDDNETDEILSHCAVIIEVVKDKEISSFSNMKNPPEVCMRVTQSVLKLLGHNPKNPWPHAQ